jgi:hypothetical protein
MDAIFWFGAAILSGSIGIIFFLGYAGWKYYVDYKDKQAKRNVGEQEEHWERQVGGTVVRDWTTGVNGKLDKDVLKGVIGGMKIFDVVIYVPSEYSAKANMYVIENVSEDRIRKYECMERGFRGRMTWDIWPPVDEMSRINPWFGEIQSYLKRISLAESRIIDLMNENRTLLDYGKKKEMAREAIRLHQEARPTRAVDDKPLLSIAAPKEEAKS